MRIHAIDQLRGLVIILMALDHVRDFFSPYAYSPEDLTQTSPELFYTRWVTHFCAPIFVFLTGISAYLFEKKSSNKNELRDFLLSRGLWLVFIEIVIVNASWKFAILPWFFVQVIWVLGISMIILAGLIYLPRSVVFVFGLIIVLGHNTFDGFQSSDFETTSWLWKLLHEPGWIPLNSKGFGIFVLYPLLPWVGLMALGYAGAHWLTDENRFVSRSMLLGVVLTVLFIGVRWLNIYVDPVPWDTQERGMSFTVMSFLNTQKYPASLAFLLMTVGPGMLILSLLHKTQSMLNRLLEVFGSVPFFFYVLHIPVIHVLSIAYFKPTINASVGWQMQTFNGFPEGYEPSMLRLYIAWIVTLVLMYFACRWFAKYKQTHDQWWLKYL
ncbi:DUF1624 domain-containing protein [Alteromonadaceae bacterium M269]|nr:DUF1624 domain-containing protein [Alteromonadaceae bacterium M269]